MNGNLLRHRLETAAGMRLTGVMQRAVAILLLIAFTISMMANGTDTRAFLQSTFTIPKAEAATGIYRPINYQGKVSQIGGTAVGNGIYNMRFKIFGAASAGVPLWTERWDNNSTRVTMTGGLFSVALGTHVTMTGSVDFNTDNLYLQVEFDPGNDGTYEETFSPRRRFGSVPYAHNANTLDGLDSTKFVRKDQAETMSGTLTVKPNDASKIGIDILSTGGAAATAGLRISTQGSNHILFGSGGTTYDVNLYRFTANVLRTDDNFYAASISGSSLEISGTMSGAIVNAQKTLSSSGTLVWEGSASGASLWVSTFEGAGLTDCDLSTSVLKWDDTLNRFSCGSASAAAEVGTAAFTGAVLVIGNDRWVNDSGDTMTGALVIDVLNGNDNTVGLEVLNTVSGSILYARKQLVSSGTLVTESGAYFDGTTMVIQAGSNRVGIGTANPLDALQVVGGLRISRADGSFGPTLTDSGDELSVNTNITSLFGVWTGGTSGKDGMRGNLASQYLSIYANSLQRMTFDGATGHVGIGTTTPGSRFSVSGAVVIGGNIGSSVAKAQLDVRGSISGATLYITSSMSGAGLTDCDASASSLQWDATTERFSCDTTAGNTYTAGQGLSLSAGNVFTLNSTITGSLIRFATLSGSVVTAKTSLASSGSLVWEGSASGASLWVSTFEGAGLTDCDLSTSVLKWDDTANRFSCGSASAAAEVGTASFTGAVLVIGNDRWVNDSGDSMSGALTIDVTGGNRSTVGLEVISTISGSVLFANTALRSSGSLVWEGAGSGQSLNLAGGNITFSRSGSTIFNEGGYAVDFRIEGDTKDALFFLDASTDRIGLGTRTPKAFFDVVGAMSGQALTLNGGAHTTTNLDSNGGRVLIRTTPAEGVTAANSGALVVLQYAERTGAPGMPKINIPAAYMFSSGSSVLMLDSGHNQMRQPGSGHILFGYRGTFDTNLYRSTGSTLRTDDTFVAETLSGSALTVSPLRNCNALKTNSAGIVSCGSGSLMIEKEATESVTSSATLQNDDHLKFAMAANTSYVVEMQVRINASDPDALGDGGFKYAFTLPAGAKMRLHTTYFTGTGSASTNCYVMNSATDVCDAGTFSTFDAMITVHGLVQTAGTTGNFQFQWAQSVINTDPTLVLKNSTLRYSPLSGAADLAEVYYTNDITLGAGDIVSIDPALELGVKKSAGAADHAVFGIVSTRPSIVIGGGMHQGYPVPIALAGRVPLKISSENGAIKPGDALMPSSIPGVAMKAKSAGTVIGQSLQAWSGTGVGIVTAYIKNYTAAGFTLLAGTGSVPTNLQTDTQLVLTSKDTDNRALMMLDTEETTAAQSVLKIVSDVGSDENTVLTINAGGSVYTDGTYNSAGADYAEWFFSKDILKKGEVVCIDVTRKNAVERCKNAADGNLMGIVSSNPAFVGNSISGADGLIPPGYHLIGLIGQVPAHVTTEGGAIRPGDQLTSASIAGYAKKAAPGDSTVGVALEGIETGQGFINVLISRRNQSLTVAAVEENVLKTIAALEIDDEVEIMIASALKDFNIETEIAEEVQRQLDVFHEYQQRLDQIANDINTLKGEVAYLRSQTGTTIIAGPATGTGTGTLPAHLTATSMELSSTLVTGGDVRAGGDFYIDGALHASTLFVPNGITIDGGAVITGEMIANELSISSGATVNGVMTINGGIQMGSGAWMDFGSGSIQLADLLVRDSLFVMGDLTIQGLATFLGDLSIKGELIVSNNQAGFAMIPKTGTSVAVYFGTGFHATPVVTASPDVPVLYGVKSSATGFTIRIAGPAVEDVIFAWHALSTGEPMTIRAAMLDGSIIFPLDSKGIPVSSNKVWNACIRNITLLDATGQPLSCARYHDEYTWTHPDLLIGFLWNTAVSPPYLKIPDGYVPTETEEAESVENAFMSEKEAFGGEAAGDSSSVSSSAVENSSSEPVTSESSSISSEASSSSASSEASVMSEASSSSTAPVVPEGPAGEPAPEAEEPLVILE